MIGERGEKCQGSQVPAPTQNLTRTQVTENPSAKAPAFSSLILTHILQIDFVKEPGKTIAIVEIDIISALAIPLSSDFPKMWVRIRALALGYLTL